MGYWLLSRLTLALRSGSACTCRLRTSFLCHSACAKRVCLHFMRRASCWLKASCLTARRQVEATHTASWPYWHCKHVEFIFLLWEKKNKMDASDCQDAPYHRA